MIGIAFQMPAWGIPLLLLANLALGAVLGALYFRNLWHSTQAFAGRGTAFAIVAAALARFVLLGAALVLVSREGALPLLCAMLGILAARFAVIRKVRVSGP
ncbi:MAG: ATP synthase subunit I [Devosia sp.]|nr:ATP synthase subunit I [Devosia sp.]